MWHQSFFQPGGIVFEEVKRRDKEQDSSVLIWCFVCKKWQSTVRGADSCPRCGTDEIEHDD